MHRQAWLLLPFLCLLGLGGFVAFRLVSPSLAIKPVAVSPQLAQVRRRAELTKSLALIGAVELSQKGAISAPEAGIVREIYVKKGEPVEARQALLVLEAPELEEDLHEARSRLRSLRETYDVLSAKHELLVSKQLLEERKRDESLAQERLALDELEALVKRGLRSSAAYGQSQRAYALSEALDLQTRAEAALQQRESRGAIEQCAYSMRYQEDLIARLEKRLDACLIRAPSTALILDGYEGNYRRGSYIARYTRLFDYALVDQAEVRLALPSWAVNRVEPGASVDIVIGSKAYPGILDPPMQLGTSTSSNVDLVVRLAALPVPLIAGQRAETRIVLERLEDRLALPEGQWLGAGRPEWVYRLSSDGQSAYRTPVKATAGYDGWVDILAGLNEGDWVLLGSYEGFGQAQTITVEGVIDDRAKRHY